MVASITLAEVTYEILDLNSCIYGQETQEDPRGSSKNKERIITATHQPWVHPCLFLTLKSPISLRRVY